jgi:hypothetical protein
MVHAESLLQNNLTNSNPRRRAYDGEEEENYCETKNPGETHGETVENNEEMWCFEEIKQEERDESQVSDFCFQNCMNSK